MGVCKVCGEKFGGVSSIHKTICPDCEPVEPPEMVPPVFKDSDNDYLYVDKIAFKNTYRYAIFYRNHITNFDADILNPAILNLKVQLNRQIVMLALYNMVLRSAGRWVRVK